MGRHYLSHLGGFRLFCCVHCETFLTNRGELITTRFTGATGRAFLFNKVVNLNYSETQDRVMLTGRHIVRDVTCKSCQTKLGWIYEYATDENQRYKEGKVILERALVNESDGLEEYMPHDDRVGGAALLDLDERPIGQQLAGAAAGAAAAQPPPPPPPPPQGPPLPEDGGPAAEAAPRRAAAQQGDPEFEGRGRHIMY